MSSIRNLFSRDSGFFYYTDKFSKLIMLNLLVIIFSLPVITFGAAVSALHYVLRHLYADEEGNVVIEFWKAFLDNSKKATCIWLCFFAVGLCLLWNYQLLQTGLLPDSNFLKWPLIIIATIIFCSAMWSFILQSRYENKMFVTVRNGFMFSLFYLPTTVLMVLSTAVPLLLLMISMKLMPFVILCGISGPGLLQVMLYIRIFKQLERLDTEIEKE